MKDYGDEHVWVIPRDHLFGAGPSPQGFLRDAVPGALDRAKAHARFVPRGPAETDGSLKQLIPYAVVTRGSEVFLLRRLNTQGEARLHNLYSLGVGGHVNPIDAEGGRDPVEAALWRELHEELAIEGTVRPRPLGLLNDDRNPVGQVHVGVVFAVDADGAGCRVRETDRMEGRFVPLAEAAKLREGMETWSQLLLDALRDSAATSGQPAESRQGGRRA